MENKQWDVLVVGAGHAGVEAALAASRLGVRVLVLTTNLDRIAYMSCNPSIGGLGKGHIVKEIDALGGEMGRAADQTCIQFKRLNARKGPAVRGSRAQCDKDLYSIYMANFLRQADGVELGQAEVKSLLIEGESCVGVVLEDGSKVFSQTVVITTGTFMNAVMHIGLKQMSGGRVGDKATRGLSDQMRELGFGVTRLKTGTPPRLLRSSVDFSQMQAQAGDERFVPLSFRSKAELNLPQVSCYLAYTNERTHEIIRSQLHQSPMYCGVIEGLGPRYCPSIEDKITRFADKERHQTFLEPEGLKTESIYLQGISTSLPEEVQYEFLRTVPGLENVKIIRPGYAVEYDFIEPSQIWHTLETKLVKGLFLAGQINGTSGYEEAAGQGLMAGINAAHKVLDRQELVLRRDQAYIGVLIDDLVTKGTKEPYRMMTSRAEYRLVLREDNTYERLSCIACDLGLLNTLDSQVVMDRLTRQNLLLDRLVNTQLVPSQETQERLRSLGTPVLLKPTSAESLLRRVEISCSDLSQFGVEVDEDLTIQEAVEIQVKYQGYIQRQKELIFQAEKLENLVLSADMDYSRVRGLSREEIEKLSLIQPRTLGQARRISGVNPSGIQALLVYLKSLELVAAKERGDQNRFRSHKSRI